MLRGEVWWANLPQPAGPRPVVLLSRDASYGLRTYCTIAPLCTRVRGIRSEVVLDRSDGLSRRCAANLDGILTVAQSAIQRRIATLSAERMRQVEDALHYALAIESCRSG